MHYDHDDYYHFTVASSKTDKKQTVKFLEKVLLNFIFVGFFKRSFCICQTFYCDDIFQENTRSPITCRPWITQYTPAQENARSPINCRPWITRYTPARLFFIYFQVSVRMNISNFDNSRATRGPNCQTSS